MYEEFDESGNATVVCKDRSKWKDVIIASYGKRELFYLIFKKPYT
jgi:hypothetical protein